MYVVCLLFYAIGGNVFDLIFLIGQDWPIDCSGFNVSERGPYDIATRARLPHV